MASPTIQLIFAAAEFLLGVGFRMDAPFKEGVPYFSRAEEARARAIAANRRNNDNYADIFIRDDDQESIEFINRIRDKVASWQSKGMVRHSSCFTGKHYSDAY